MIFDYFFRDDMEFTASGVRGGAGDSSTCRNGITGTKPDRSAAAD